MGGGGRVNELEKKLRVWGDGLTRVRENTIKRTHRRYSPEINDLV